MQFWRKYYWQSIFVFDILKKNWPWSQKLSKNICFLGYSIFDEYSAMVSDFDFWKLNSSRHLFDFDCQVFVFDWNRLFAIRYTTTEMPIILNSKAHIFWPKSAQKGAQFFSPKSAIFLVKSAQFLTPQTIFIAFLCINFFQISNFVKKKLIFQIFFYIFP